MCRKQFAGAALVVLLAGCAASGRAPVEIPVRLAQILREGEEAESAGNGLAAFFAYKRATEEFADYSVAWSHLGEYQRFWQREPSKAELSFKRAIDSPLTTESSVAFSWRGLGEIARGNGDVDTAIACLQKSLSVLPSTEAFRSLSALYATEKRDFELARHYAFRALKESPEDPIALMQYAVQMVRFNDREEATKAFNQAIRIVGCDDRGWSDDPVHCCVLYNGACYHAVRGDKPKALSMLTEFFRTANHRHITREEILRDPDFESLVSDADFLALLNYRLPEE